jgi:hypothetical protein
VGFTGALGIQPWVAPGFGLSIGHRFEFFSVDLEGALQLPTSLEVLSGKVTVRLVGGAAVPCFHFWKLGACGVVVAAALDSEGTGFEDARQVVTPYVALGARGLLELPLTPQLLVAVRLDFLVPLATTSLRVGGNEVFSTFPVAGRLGLFVVAEI